MRTLTQWQSSLTFIQYKYVPGVSKLSVKDLTKKNINALTLAVMILFVMQEATSAWTPVGTSKLYICQGAKNINKL
jgi:hypothetical protein